MLERRPLPELEEEILYYDAELDVATSKTHRHAAVDLCNKLEPVAQALGLFFLSDESIWYLDPNTDKQKVFFGDLVLSRRKDSVTAKDLQLVIEVVSTYDRRKELKDTIRQRVLNEFNAVPEFGLYFPDVGDSRNFELFRLDPDARIYAPVAPKDGRLVSSSVPGLEVELLPRERWRDAFKIDVYFEGRRLLSADEERARADREAARAEQEAARAERLAARLRELGIDPQEP